MESTLAIQFKELKARVGSFLGWGRGADYGDTAWTGRQKFEIDGIVASGLRQYYWPPPVPGQEANYDWSFLRPTASLTLPVNGSAVPLPDDYGGVEDKITVLTTNTTSQPWRIEWTNEANVRGKYSATPTMSGPPMWAAVAPLKGTTVNTGQRFELLIFPLADAAYTLQLEYYLNPDYLTSQAPFAYGGAQHAETVLESCLAVAEQRLDDASRVHAAKFLERLQASIAIDRKHRPQALGYNGDRSDYKWDNRLNPHWWAPVGTYNGTGFN